MKTQILPIMLCIILLSTSDIYSQQHKWFTLPNAPVASSRFNDCSFINPNTGWVCSADNTNIYKTIDGGDNWFIVGNSNTSNRSICFFDSLTGFVGEYNAANRINRTTDGGISWQIMTLPLNSSGICGFSKVNDSVMYGCGRYWGNARVIKTTDKGNNWIVISMSAYTSGLVDCYFTSQDSGIVVGKTIGNPAYGIVLKTNDGGITWETSCVTPNYNQWCWKITFPTRNIGYISLERASTTNFFLKTTDGGNTWEEKRFLFIDYDEEGIGFINPNTGWIGGWEDITYQTTNGGDNWSPIDASASDGPMVNMNRYRFFGDTLGYAVGKRIHKYRKDVMTGINNSQSLAVNSFKLHQNYPNPFNPRTKIKIEMPEGGDVRIIIYNVLGNEVSTLIEGDYLSKGIHEFEWDASEYPSGVYYYKVFSKGSEFAKAMQLIK